MNFYQPSSKQSTVHWQGSMNRSTEWYANHNPPQQSLDYYEDVPKRSQQSNSVTIQDSHEDNIYVNSSVPKQIEKKKQKKGINKPFVLATASMVLSLALMLVVIVMLIKLSNDQVAATAAMNQKYFQLAKEHSTKEDLQAQINNLFNETNLLLKLNDEKQKNLTHSFIQGYLELEDRWITPFNGFQYKYNTTRKNWADARTACYEMGGDLASFGIWDIETRRILGEAFNLYNHDAWIGLNDINSEGRWYWVTSYRSNNGKQASEATALWYSGQPSSSSSLYDCAFLHFYNLFSYAQRCHNTFSFLCEKKV